MKNLLYKINLYAQIVNFIYARKVIKELSSSAVLQDYYHLTNVKGDKMHNPIMIGNRMHLELPLPVDIKEYEIDDYFSQHMKVVLNSLLSLDLYGLIKVKKDIYYNEEFNREESETDDLGIIHVQIFADNSMIKRTIILYSLLLATVFLLSFPTLLR